MKYIFIHLYLNYIIKFCHFGLYLHFYTNLFPKLSSLKSVYMPPSISQMYPLSLSPLVHCEFVAALAQWKVSRVPGVVLPFLQKDCMALHSMYRRVILEIY